MKKVLSILAFVIFTICILTACNGIELSLAFDANGGSFDNGEDTIYVTTNGTSNISIPDNPTREGFIFDGWFWDNDTYKRAFTANSLLDEPIQDDMTVYAKWVSDEGHLQESVTYTITFNTNGGNDISPLTIEEGSTISMPDAPIKEGYSFENWYLDNDTFEREFTANLLLDEPIQSNMIVYAKWDEEQSQPATLIVTFEDWDGKVIATETVDYGSSATAPADPERGATQEYTYTFEGWDTAFDNVTKNITVNARYAKKVNTYTVTFDGNGGMLIDGQESQTVEYGNSAVAPDYEKEGFAFNGWDNEFDNICEDLSVSAKWYTVGLSFTLYNNDKEYSVGRGTADEEEIIIPESFNNKPVTKIGSFTFDRSQIKSIIIPDGIKEIGSGAFYNCSSLESITIPQSVTRIGGDVFTGCSSLESIEVSEENNNYNSIEGVLFNKEETILMQYPGNAASNYIIHDGVTNIANSAFRECNNLESIIIPDSITGMGIFAFDNCKNLKSVSFGENIELEFLHVRVFGFCSTLERIDIPKSVTCINDHAFRGNSSLESITIPDSVESIGKSVFYDCNSLISVIMKSQTPPSIGNDVFTSTHSELKIYVSNLSLGLYKMAENWSEYADNFISEDIDCCIIEDGVFIEYTGNATSITIPDNITNIASYAFSECSNLEHIIIPDSITSIGDGAFQNCNNLKRLIAQSESPPTLGAGVFDNTHIQLKIYAPNRSINAYKSSSGWNDYTDIIYASPIATFETNGGSEINPEDVEYNTAISEPESPTKEGYNFVGWYIDEELQTEYDFNSLIMEDITLYAKWQIKSLCFTHVSGGYSVSKGTVTSSEIILPSTYNGEPVVAIANNGFNYTQLTSITIPDSVTIIGSRAFMGCSSLKSVNIPDSVTSIGAYAFMQCDSLDSVTIPESVTIIGMYAFHVCDNLKGVIVESQTPPILEENGYLYFNNPYRAIMYIFVPDQSVDEYKSAEGWSVFDENIYSRDLICDGGFFVMDGELRHYVGNNTSITVPDSITSIDSFSFWRCASIESVTIPDSVTSYRRTFIPQLYRFDKRHNRE